MRWQARRQLPGGLLEHGLDPLHSLLLLHGGEGRLGAAAELLLVVCRHRRPHGHRRHRAAVLLLLLLLLWLVRRLQGGWQVHQALDLDAVAGAHVGDVVEVRRGRDQLGTAVRVPK